MDIPKILSIKDIKIGSTDNFYFKITKQMMLDFEKISGDSSPLHVDSSFAISRGYKDIIVYGGLLFAKTSKMLGMKLPGGHSLCTNLNLSFLKPLYVNEKAKIVSEVTHISESTSSVELIIKIFSVKDNILKARGKANTIVTTLKI